MLQEYIGIFAMCAGVQVIWTLIIRTFPQFVGGALLKGIERRDALALEKIKDDLGRKTQTEIEKLRADYSMLRSAVDFISSSQGEVRTKMIESAERLWGQLLSLKREFGVIIYLDTVFLPMEIDEAIQNETPGAIIDCVNAFRKFGAVAAKLKRAEPSDAEEDRIFASNRLWLLFFVARALYGRTGMLIHMSVNEKKFRDWRNDSFIDQVFSGVIAEDVLAEAKKRPVHGLQSLISVLETEFIAEAAKIMSGVHSFSESLPHMQASLIAEKERIMRESA